VDEIMCRAVLDGLRNIFVSCSRVDNLHQPRNVFPQTLPVSACTQQRMKSAGEPSRQRKTVSETLGR
jgi:hypothetical protein